MHNNKFSRSDNSSSGEEESSSAGTKIAGMYETRRLKCRIVIVEDVEALQRDQYHGPRKMLMPKDRCEQHDGSLFNNGF